MSRHRSPAGRHAHPRPVPVAQPGAWVARPRPAAPQPGVVPQRGAAVQTGMTAAAVAGGVLAVVVPTFVAMADHTPDRPPSAALTLTAGDTARPAEPTVSTDSTDSTDSTGYGATTLVATLSPVVERDLPPPQFDVDELLKAAGLADVVRRAAEEAAAAERAEQERLARCDPDLDGLGRVKAWVREGTEFLSCLYDGPDVIGVAQRGRQSDHPSGHAVDLMVRGGQGDRIAECALANQDELGIAYVLWEQRANYGDGWERMSDRGGDTENHYDHVHISFEHSAPDGEPVSERCD